MLAEWAPTESDTAYKRVGGSHVVRAIVTHFFDVMEEQEPALAALHRCEPPGHVNEATRERLTVFLIGWLGGPKQPAEERRGPPISFRGVRIAVSGAMGDAWLRCMHQALDCATIDPVVRRYLDRRFADVGDFLRGMAAAQGATPFA